MRIFENREAAGQALVQALRDYARRPEVLVLALPRGGVPVAKVVADALHIPFDILLVRKLGVPWQPELAFGAVAEGDTLIVQEGTVRSCGLRPEQVQRVIAEEQAELSRRARVFRGDGPPVDVRGRTILLIDDGLATGSTMQAAVQALKHRRAGKVIVAVPVGPPAICRKIEADEVICLEQPDPFDAVGAWYIDFHQMTDDEVRALLPE